MYFQIFIQIFWDFLFLLLFQEHQNNTVGNTMQNAMALLSNLIGQKGTDLRPFYQQGAVHLNVTRFDISALRFLVCLWTRKHKPTQSFHPDTATHMKRACIQRAALVLFWSVFIPLPDPYCSHLAVWLSCVTLMEGEGVQLPFLRASTRYCCFYQRGLLCGGPVAHIYLVSHPSSPHITHRPGLGI